MRRLIMGKKQDVIPPEYTVYDYMYCASGKLVYETGRINLKKFDNLDGFSFEYKMYVNNSVGQGIFIWGSRTDSNFLSSFALYMMYQNANRIRVVDHNVAFEYTTNIPKMRPFTVKYTNSSTSPSYLQVDDNPVMACEWENGRITPNPIALFSNVVPEQSNNLTTNHRMYNLKLYDENMVLVGDYIPCTKVINGATRIGLYDKVTREFYTSSTASYTTVGNSNCAYRVANE